MGEPYKFDLLDLSGGHVDGQPATHIADKEMASLVNFRTYGTKLVRREGVKRLTTEPNAERLTSVFRHKDSVGTLTTVFSILTGFAKLVAGVFSSIPYSGPAITPTTRPGHWWQYLGIYYYVREGLGLLRGNADAIDDAGIVGPTVAPTVVQGAAGNLPAGVYKCRYRFGNSTTGARSNWSPEATVPLVANKKIDWSVIAVSTNSQVDMRELLRTTADQTALFVAQTIEDNSTTTFTGDNAVVDELGDLAEDDHDLPPDNLIGGTAWDDRSWVHDGKEAFYSADGLMESFPTENRVPIFPDSEGEIRAIVPWIDKIMFLKTNAIHYIRKASSTTYELKTLDDQVGCYSEHSAKASLGRLFWFGTGKQFWISQGGAAVPLDSYKIRTILDDIPDARVNDVIACLYPEFNIYVAIVPQSTGESKVLAYNYLNSSWSIFTHEQSMAYMNVTVDENLIQVIYAVTDDGHLYQYLDKTEYRDFNHRFLSSFLTKKFDAGRPGFLLENRFIYLLTTDCANNVGDVQVGLYRDGHLFQSTVHPIYLHAEVEGWKQFRLSSLGYPSTNVQLYFETQDDERVEIHGYSMQGVMLNRLVRR